MPYSASSTATPCVIVAIAPLLAAYGVEFGHAQRTLMEAVLTMAPLGPVRHEGARGSLRAVEAAKVIVVNDAGVLSSVTLRKSLNRLMPALPNMTQSR